MADTPEQQAGAPEAPDEVTNQTQAAAAAVTAVPAAAAPAILRKSLRVHSRMTHPE